MAASNLAQWRPQQLLANARRQSLEEFTSECESPYLLLIRLTDLDSELAVGLATEEARDRDGLAFRTVQRDVSSVMESLEAVKKERARVDLRSTQKLSLRDLGGTAGGALPLGLRSAICHVLPLRKRTEAAFLRSVSVGRARNHDIVLRHRSVSKFHGAFDLDEQGRLFVRDANSSNHTFVNGQQVTERAEVRSGDEVQFGSVETRLCTTEELWRTLRG